MSHQAYRAVLVAVDTEGGMKHGEEVVPLWNAHFAAIGALDVLVYTDDRRSTQRQAGIFAAPESVSIEASHTVCWPRSSEARKKESSALGESMRNLLERYDADRLIFLYWSGSAHDHHVLKNVLDVSTAGKAVADRCSTCDLLPLVRRLLPGAELMSLSKLRADLFPNMTGTQHTAEFDADLMMRVVEHAVFKGEPPYPDHAPLSLRRAAFLEKLADGPLIESLYGGFGGRATRSGAARAGPQARPLGSPSYGRQDILGGTWGTPRRTHLERGIPLSDECCDQSCKGIHVPAHEAQQARRYLRVHKACMRSYQRAIAGLNTVTEFSLWQEKTRPGVSPLRAAAGEATPKPRSPLRVRPSAKPDKPAPRALFRVKGATSRNKYHTRTNCVALRGKQVEAQPHISISNNDICGFCKKRDLTIPKA